MNVHLTRGRIAATVIALATFVAVVLLVVAARGWWRGDGGSYAPARAMLVRTEVTPARSLFGQVLTAHAELVVDPRRVDPSSVDLKADLRPFHIRSASRRVVDGPGRATIVDFRYQIQCISRDCVPLESKGRARGAASVQHLGPTVATGRGREGRDFVTRVSWPVFAVQSRLTSDEIAFSTPQVDGTFTAPAVSWAISPNLLGAIAGTAALLLVLGAAWLTISVVWDESRLPRGPRIPGHLTAIDRALALAEYAAAHGETAESRKALERLATELRRQHAVPAADTHANDAEQLAWSEEGPSPATVAALASVVRSNGAG